MCKYESVRWSGPPQSRAASLPVQVEDLSALDEDELYDLVLVDHVDRHVSSVQLRPHQRWAEHDADALSGHQVLPGEGQNSEKQQDKITDGNMSTEFIRPTATALRQQPSTMCINQYVCCCRLQAGRRSSYWVKWCQTKGRHVEIHSQHFCCTLTW